jgi:mannosyltransferase OCH1-like enzyme
MTAAERAAQALAAAEALREAGDYAGARALLDGLARHPDAAALGETTALGLPRRLHAALLRLAKTEGDVIARIGYQFHLVPDPARLAALARATTAEKRAIATANRQPVPRTLHQVWIGALPPPPATEAWAAHAAAQGYSYRIWREADLAALGFTETPACRAMLERGDLPGAVDAARYRILEREGGIYLDCDWYPARDDLGFHDLLPLTGLTAMAEDIPRQTGAGALLLANSFIAAPPGHPVLSRLNAALPAVLAEMPRAPAWWSTGPLIFTLMARMGSLTLADAGLVAATLRRGAPFAEVAALRASAEVQGTGLLIGWKSW